MKYMKSIFFTIILIAVQACIMSAKAQNEGVNSIKKTELTTAQELLSLKQEKLTIESNLKQQEAACYKKFAVNNCLKDAKTEAQTAQNVVKRREIAINDQQHNAKAAVKKVDNNSGTDKTSEVKDATKAVKPAKHAKAIKSDAQVLAEKDVADKSRADAAQKRLVDLNQKQADFQKNAQIRASKHNQSAANSASYNRKLNQAEEHKQALEKMQLAKKKLKSAPLPIPASTP
jgi:colicin import membrane protein